MSKISIWLVFMFTCFYYDSLSIGIVPKPNFIIHKSGDYEVSEATKLVYSIALSKEAKYFLDILRNEFGLSLEEKITNPAINETGIVIEMDASQMSELGDEGYTLMINKDGVFITGATTNGVFYGLQSLRQLFQKGMYSSDKFVGTYKLPRVEIRDKPRFAWRSFMLDVSRHFYDTSVIKKLLDEMALLKMNVFHWHLTDDQGWRVPISKYPKLISIASKRDSSQISFYKNEEGENVFEFDGKPHQGYYSHEDILMIIKYAEERRIQVIPEIDMPSHNQAAMAAYPWLSTTQVTSKVPTVFFGEPYYRNPAEVNIADPKVVQFFRDVLDEIIELFPSDIIHIGGDEVWYNLWAESIAINEFMEENGFQNYADLQMWFTSEMSEYLAKKGKRMMGWNDILGGHLDENDLNNKMSVNFRPVPGTIIGFWRGDVPLMNEVAMQGYDIINGINSFTYFNSDYAGLPLEKAYSFEPVPTDIDLQNVDQIKGVACHLWTELIPNRETLYAQLFPRIAATAEVGWTEKSNKSFDDFKKGLETLLVHWTNRGITWKTE